MKIAKIKGQEVPWHNHENEDELFYIIEGELLMEIEMRTKKWSLSLHTDSLGLILLKLYFLLGEF